MKKFVLAFLTVFTLALAVPVSGALAAMPSDQATDPHGNKYDHRAG